MAWGIVDAAIIDGFLGRLMKSQFLTLLWVANHDLGLPSWISAVLNLVPFMNTLVHALYFDGLWRHRSPY